MINKQKWCRYEKLPSASNPIIINRKNLRHQKEMWAKIHLIKISCQMLQRRAKNKCFISFHWPSDLGNISRRWCRLCCSTIHERMFLWGMSSILHCCSFTFTCNCTTLSYHCSCTCGLWGMSSILHCCSCSCTCLHHPTIVHLHCLGFQPK